jgi:hypothetical protein
VYYRVGFWNDVHREELLDRAKEAHPHGLLVCARCRFVWLNKDTAKVDLDGEVVCMEDRECFRRRIDLVGPPADEWREKPKRKRKRPKKKAQFAPGTRGN